MRILGIDPGLGITGYGVIENHANGFKLIEAGVIRTDLKEKIDKRLSLIHKELLGLVDDLKPGLCALEELYSHYKHPRTSILMAHARGVVCLACAQRNIPIVSYSAKRVKKAIVGTGNASKEQIQRMVQNILGLRSIPQPADVADALALAIAHVYMKKKI